MSSFDNYLTSFAIGCDPAILDIGRYGQEYCIFTDSGPLLTPGGNRFSHPLESVIHMIIADLQLESTINVNKLSSPVLYSFRRDYLDSGSDPIDDQWDNLITSDPFVRIKSSGIPINRPFSSDDPLFTFSILTLTGLIVAVNDFSGRAIGEFNLEEGESQMFARILRLSYDRLSADRKVAVQAMSSSHHSGIVLPLLLVSGDIGPAEYARGIISLKMRPKGTYPEILSDIARMQGYLDSLMPKPGHGRSIPALVMEGESETLEFKSTLRWDVRAGKSNPAIERSSLKTISAFLNTKGGILLIGVRDDGSVEGIETDKFANEDKFLLHLWTLIRNCLGREFSGLIRTRAVSEVGKTVCIVECSPANRPVFLRQPGFDEEMFIRVGPSSNALDISEALKYIEDRFPRIRG